MGIHTAIETNGYFGDKLSDADLASIDLVMLGIKMWDPTRHRSLTGMDIGPTLAFARRLAALRKPIWVRFVLVPGLSDDEETLEGIAGFARSLGNVARVEVLPFHQMGRYKWVALGLTYTLSGTEPPTQASVDRACAVFRAQGLTAY